MKRFALLTAFVVLALSVSAHSLRYFTYTQAARTTSFLNTQDEMMVYAGYEYEIETYILINEVWAERVNSQFYEIWVYGYDAYTGEEVMMPLDLSTVWLINNRNGHMYSAASYLKFHHSRPMPSWTWMRPPYNPYVHRHHPEHFCRTYHYDVHLYGWHYNNSDPHHHHHYHDYYMRTPDVPVYYNPAPYNPGSQTPNLISHAQMTNHGKESTSGRTTVSTTRPNYVTNPGHAPVTTSRTSTTASGSNAENIRTSATNGSNRVTTGSGSRTSSTSSSDRNSGSGTRTSTSSNNDRNSGSGTRTSTSSNSGSSRNGSVSRSSSSTATGTRTSSNSSSSSVSRSNSGDNKSDNSSTSGRTSGRSSRTGSSTAASH